MNAPIGLFDSGVGGLSVLQALEQILPHEDCLYFGDSAHFPYSAKTKAELIRYASQITSFLLSQNIKMLIIACHTASVHVLRTLQANFPIPIIGMMQPTLAALKNTTKNGRIAILATEATIRSEFYQNAIREKLPNAYILPLTCSQLETTIEQGKQPSQALVKKCIHPMLDQQIDTLLLACTHYPHILLEIEEELNPETTVLNPSLEVAREAKKQLKETSPDSHTPHHILYTSGSIEPFQKFLKNHPLKTGFTLKKALLCKD